MSTCQQCGHESADPFQYCPRCGTKCGSEGGDSLVGRILNDKYRLIEVIGSGATGTVFRGEHVGLKKRVALKVLHADLDLGAEALQRFQREGIAAGKFSHPNAIDIFDFDKADGDVVFLAMEFVEGKSLRDYLEELGKLPPAEAFDLTRQILGALAAAHAQGIVHRDLKPDNVMVSGDRTRPRVKVLDFGLSKLLDRKLDVSLQTQIGRIMGTPLYMSPEQCAGEETDARSDLYAVGLLLYEMLAGMRPFAGHETTELLLVRVTREAPSLHEDHPQLGVSEELDDFLSKALARSRGERFQTAEEMREALDALPIDGKAAGPRRRRSDATQTRSAPPGAGSATGYGADTGSGRGARRLAAAALVLAVGAAGYAWWTTRAGPSPAPVNPLVESQLTAARTMLAVGQLVPALAAVEGALDLDENNVEGYLLRASIYRARGDDDTARYDVDEALRLDEDSADAHLASGWLAYDGEDLEAAGKAFTRARELAPQRAEPLTALGALARRLGRADEARALLAEAVANAPQDVAAQTELGTLLLQAGEFEGAKQAFVQAKRADSTHWQAYRGLAETLAAEGDRDAAIDQYRQALPLARTESALHLDLATLLLDGERSREALEVLDEAAARFPREPRLHALRGAALELEGDVEEAIDALERARRNGLEDPESTTLLAVLLHESGRKDRALALFEDVRRQAGEVPLVNKHLGLLYFETGRAQEAVARLESVLDFLPQDTVALYNLGLLHMDYMGQPQQAVEFFRRYLDAGGTSGRVRGWLRRLGG